MRRCTRRTSTKEAIVKQRHIISQDGTYTCNKNTNYHIITHLVRSLSFWQLYQRGKCSPRHEVVKNNRQCHTTKMDTFVKKGDVLVTAALFPHSLRLSAEPRTTLIFTSTLLSTMRTTSLSLHGILLAAIIDLATPRIAWGAEVQQVGDDAKRRSSSDTCRLFMARSTIPNAGIGVFTAVVSMSWFAVCACT
jgi:hypothetical protein